MKCLKHVNSYIGVNTYLVGDDTCYIIDPGSDGKIIAKKVQENFKGVKAILLTHAHIDHILSVDYLADLFHCPIYLHSGDLEYVNGSYSSNYMIRDFLVEIKNPISDVLTLNDPNIRIYETPGHSKGSVCFHFLKEKLLFTGDTLFAFSIGRVDLPGGSQKEMWASLRFLKTLDDDLIVHPGHEESSSIGLEKKRNYYLSKV